MGSGLYWRYRMYQSMMRLAFYLHYVVQAVLLCLLCLFFFFPFLSSRAAHAQKFGCVWRYNLPGHSITHHTCAINVRGTCLKIQIRHSLPFGCVWRYNLPEPPSYRHICARYHCRWYIVQCFCAFFFSFLSARGTCFKFQIRHSLPFYCVWRWYICLDLLSSHLRYHCRAYYKFILCRMIVPFQSMYALCFLW